MSVAQEQPIELHVVAHTHWDREWYRPAAQFRIGLVSLIDELLDSPEGRPFLLDGQSVLLDDYLETRPERASEISARLRDGTLEAGPWYVLPDELIPGGEGLIRNLLAGRRVLRRLRAEPPAVLYCPDSFGHPASLATLAAGFGCAVAVVWRGYGSRRWPAGSTVRWRAPDGSQVLLYHLPRAGYEAGSHLPADDEAAPARAVAVRRELLSRPSLGAELLPQGADHHAPQPRQAEALAALERALEHVALRRSTLAGFADRLVALAATRALPTIDGELRDSYGYTWTLAGTLAARAQLKRRYALAERLLVRDTEPWAALAHLRDGRGRRHLVDGAWRQLLLCQPHDTLCGCSIDAVARATAGRLEEAVASAESIRDQSLDALLGHDPVAARPRSDAWSAMVVLRNASAQRRSGLAEVDLDIVLAEEAVGPGSAGATEPRVPAPSGPVSLGAPAIPVQVLSRTRLFVREESPRHYPRNRLVERRRVVAWVDAVPAFGLRLLSIGRARRPRAAETALATTTELSNGRLRVAIDGEGLSLRTADGHEMRDILAFEGEAERGDLYTHSAVPGTNARARFAGARVLARGPLRAELATKWSLELPSRDVTTATGERLTAPRATVGFRARVQLDAGAPFVRVLISGENRATDVRLRCAIATGIRAPTVFADAAFGAVERRGLEIAPEDALMEHAPPTAPLHRYVTLSNDSRGCTVYSDGLAEYEADERGTVFITLLRGVRELSRRDLPERPGHAGWPVETPEAQSLGPFQAMVAVMPHGPRRPALVPVIDHVADDVLHPLSGHTWRTAIAPPDFVEGVQLVGRGLSFSAMKESEDGESVVLRCVNLLSETVAGAWRVPGMREAWLARLDETPLGARTVRSGVVTFEAAPRAVVTMLVR